MSDSSQNKKIIDGVIVLSEFNLNQLQNPTSDKTYLYAEDDGIGNTRIKTFDSAGQKKELLNNDGSNTSSSFNENAGILGLVNFSSPYSAIVTGSAPNDNITFSNLKVTPNNWKLSNSTVTSFFGGMNLTGIGANSFNNCSNFESVYLLNAKEIKNSAFNFCTSLKDVFAPRVKKLYYEAFNYTPLLTGISMPELEEAQYDGFYDAGLISVDFPKLKNIPTNFFRGCPLTGRVNLPSVTGIGLTAFYSSSIRTGSFTGVTFIATNAFSNSAITKIHIPNIESFGTQVFSFSALNEIYLNCAFTGVTSNTFTDSSITGIHVRPYPNTPNGWTVGTGQTIGGKSNITVIDDWVDYPNLPS